jgi:hypothetical protein
MAMGNAFTLVSFVSLFNTTVLLAIVFDRAVLNKVSYFLFRVGLRDLCAPSTAAASLQISIPTTSKVHHHHHHHLRPKQFLPPGLKL